MDEYDDNRWKKETPTDINVRQNVERHIVVRRTLDNKSYRAILESSDRLYLFIITKRNSKCMLNVHSGYMFKENIFSRHFRKKNVLNVIVNDVGGFSNNVKTGNFRRRTLRRLTKPVVTNY